MLVYSPCMGYPNDWFDGEERPPLVLRESLAITSTHQGSVHVEAGAALNLRGTLQGSLHVQSGSTAVISGVHQGSLHVESGASVWITGQQQGSLHNLGHVVVEHGATAAGSVENRGTLVIRGRQGGQIRGSGAVDIADGGVIVKPTIREGISYYEWS